MLKPPSATERAAWLRGLGDDELHGRLLAEVPCLHEVEQWHAGPDVELHGWVRVAAWNVQRGRRPAQLAGLLRETGADVMLLSELDSGMARTGNENVVDVIASDTGCGYAYGVEFVELGLGDESEQREAAGAQNEWGLHGNAIVSRSWLHDAEPVRLPEAGTDALWFAAGSPQPRVGGRLAVVATVSIEGVPVQVASTHLENRGDTDHRAEQMEVVLRAVDARAGAGPAIVAGDFNTMTTNIEDLLDRGVISRLRADEPARFTWPVAHEPLFAVAATYGFAWTEANVAAPTTHHDAGGLPDHVPLKLDWILVRGLEARRPAVVPSAGLSDHHLVACSVRLR